MEFIPPPRKPQMQKKRTKIVTPFANVFGIGGLIPLQDDRRRSKAKK